jgi:hypothetical protein
VISLKKSILPTTDTHLGACNEQGSWCNSKLSQHSMDLLAAGQRCTAMQQLLRSKIAFAQQQLTTRFCMKVPGSSGSRSAAPPEGRSLSVSIDAICGSSMCMNWIQRKAKEI